MLALYFSPRGRIGRKTWWLGVLGLGVLGLILAFGLLFPVMWEAISALDFESLASSTTTEQLIELNRRVSRMGLVCYAVLAYPSYCLGVKRRHDRDNPGWDVLAYLAASSLVSLIPALGYGFELVDAGGGLIAPGEVWWMTVLTSLLSLAGLYLIVILGLAKGTSGPNSYGPDPLHPYGR